MSHRTVSLFRSVVAAALVAVCLSGSVQAQSRVSVRGRVKVAGFGSPVDNAVVRFEPLRLGLRVERTTDKSGTFQADSIVPGVYRLTVHCDGYEPLVMSTIQVRPSENLELDIPLTRTR